MSNVGYTSNFRTDTERYPLTQPIDVSSGKIGFLLVDDIASKTIGGGIQSDSPWFISQGLTVANDLEVDAIQSTDGSGRLVLKGITLAPTSGSVSGQHLQVNINGVNYKIELKNP